MKNAIKYASKLIHERYLHARISLIDLFPYSEYLLNLTKECDNITEIILSPIHTELTFTWAMIDSLNISKEKYKKIYQKDKHKKFVSISKHRTHKEIPYLKDLSIYSEIEFENKRVKKDIDKIEETDMLFIFVDSRVNKDSTEILNLINSLEKFVKKYIVVYDRALNYDVIDFRNEISNLHMVKNSSIYFLQNNYNWSLLTGYNTEYTFTMMKRFGDNNDDKVYHI